MDNQLQTAKATLRRQMRGWLRELSAADRARTAEAACQRLRQQPVWITAKSVLFFAPLPQELNIWTLITEARATGRTVALPRFDPTTQQYTAAVLSDLNADLRPGWLGIPEPHGDCPNLAMNRLDLILVPGLAFDPCGRRLGRGKGYYDRLLADAPGMKCGVAFDEQVVSEVPVGPQDVRLNCILTPSRWLEC